MSIASNCSGYPDDVVAALAKAVYARRNECSRPLRVGISGLQGSGKSTLARQLVVALKSRTMTMTSFSLDDFYLTRSERQLLSRAVHPLLATRGVPGTHDIELLNDAFELLATASEAQPVAIPHFDKATDDRAIPLTGQSVCAAPDVILFDGWCVGVSAQVDAELIAPVNALERDEDSDGRWRYWVNTMLREHYEPIWRSLDLLIVLHAPSFNVVQHWRGAVEHDRREHGDCSAMSRQQLTRFIAHFERLSRHALLTLPASASLLLRLDAKRTVLGIEQ